ncbi:MAG: carbohydrate ABC transporter permease [Defluviitaleaceae bacterium]|nr:carbohydrate ABC transporter permease [Defluviitaleaceae bacterium]
MKIKSSVPSKLFDILNILMLFAFFVITIYPFYYIFIYSISDPNLSARGAVVLLPAGITFKNYIQVFQLKGIGHAALISVLRTVIGTAITLFCCSFIAYLVTKERLRFRKFIYRFLIITMYLNAGLIPWYLTMQMYGFSDNFLLYIIPSAVQAYFVILIKVYIESIPPSLEESAELDGAGYMQRFWRIVIPTSIPILATVAIFSLVNQWNTWYDNYFLVRSENLMTLQIKLKNFMDQINYLVELIKSGHGTIDPTKVITPTAVRMTITMVVTFPILVVYPILQRYFVKGIMMGAIKG